MASLELKVTKAIFQLAENLLSLPPMEMKT